MATKRTAQVLAVILAVVAPIAVGVRPAPAQPPPDPPGTTVPDGEPKATDLRGRRPDAAEVGQALAAADRAGQARVLVALRAVATPYGQQTDADNRRQHTEIAQLQDRALRSVRKGAVVRRFTTVPVLAVVAPAEEIRALAANDAVAAVALDRELAPSLSTTTSIVGATAVNQRGVTGQGQSVAILDTGVDTAHPFLAGRVVDEACYGTCPNGQTGPGSGVNCPLAITGCDHGTHVAGIAVGAGGPGIAGFNGVAPGATYLSVNVFHRVDNFWPFNNCGSDPSPCARSYISDQIAGLEHVFLMRDAFRIAAVNLSLGDSAENSPCSWAWTSPAIDNLRSVGIATVIAAGNDGHANGLSEPACVPSAVSVGATSKSDSVMSWSNSASYLSLLAPGSAVLSSVPGGGFAAMSGTSMAAPHVAGAFALIKEEYPWAAVTTVVNRLRTTGRILFDPKSLWTTPRLDVDRALRFDTFNHDFNRDLVADYTVWRPSTGQWFAPGFGYTTWGVAGDVPVAGEYSGKAPQEQAVFRPSSGQWWITGQPTVTFGGWGDKPVPGDYNADGYTDIAVWRPSDGYWFVRNLYTLQWGAPGDIPLPGDYNGDGRTDFAVWRPSTGVWHVYGQFAIEWGTAGDVPVPGDYNADGRTDLAVWRPSTGQWWVRGQFTHVLGATGDVPAPRDLTGDGRADPAVWHPWNGWWDVHINVTPTLFLPMSYQFGQSGDIPV